MSAVLTMIETWKATVTGPRYRDLQAWLYRGAIAFDVDIAFTGESAALLRKTVYYEITAPRERLQAFADAMEEVASR